MSRRPLLHFAAAYKPVILCNKALLIVLLSQLVDIDSELILSPAVATCNYKTYTIIAIFFSVDIISGDKIVYKKKMIRFFLVYAVFWFKQITYVINLCLLE